VQTKALSAGHLRSEVSTGGIPVDDVVTGAYIQSQYWLIVQPPTQTVSGDPPWMFDLDVSLAGLSDHEDDAVHYRPLPNYDEVLVVDTSDSMDNPADYPKMWQLRTPPSCTSMVAEVTCCATVQSLPRRCGRHNLNDLSRDGVNY
jgi:hypothetical protein